MNYDEYGRALKLYAMWLQLNPTGKKALQNAIERQAPHHGHDTLNALIAAMTAYLQTEGE